MSHESCILEAEKSVLYMEAVLPIDSESLNVNDHHEQEPGGNGDVV